MGSDTFKIRVAGVSHYRSQVDAAEMGDIVTFEPEPTNPYDPNAIKVMSSGRQLGYVPKDQAVALVESIGYGATIADGVVVGKGKPEGSDCFGLVVEFTVCIPDGPSTDADGRTL